METRSFLDIDGLLAEFRLHLRLTSQDLDDILLMDLKAAVAQAEKEISGVIALSEFTLSCMFSSSIPLRWPVTGVTSVEVDGETLEEDDYTVSSAGIVLADTVSGTSVSVTYTAGLSQIPDDMKAAILLLGATLFNNPTDRPEERDRTAAKNLLRPYRCWGEHGDGE